MFKFKPFFLVFLTCFLVYCHTNKPLQVTGTATPAATPQTETEKVDFSTSPVIPAQEAIAKMQLESGFEVKLVASEPLVSTPVAVTFDNKARMWVVEMENYMPDTVGTGEDIPTGKIVILEDTDNDGAANTRQVFLDSLVLPRAICLIENGILVAEPPSLYYYEIKNAKPGKKILVDAAYAEGGNVEHQPNGLYRALDNWIYNAKSSKRYRKKGDTWLIERTHFRGQWGISQDNYGRLYYNTNSENLLGDYFSPGLGATNKNQRRVAGYVQKVVADNKVYPSHPTPGVNRGYMKGILTTDKRLVDFTAACGPLVYRGDLFDASYTSNVFVAEPSANLIKRNIIKDQELVSNGKQAYQGREFLSSTDERFRPVNLHDGPDGALYVVDMYRGIIQHKTYLTTYLKKEIGKRELTQPLNCGRIYKIVPTGKNAKAVTLPEDPAQLVTLLGHTNGWVRDKAQQMLIDGKYMAAVPALRQAVKDKNNPLLVMHALWTLEGLGQLQTAEVIALLKEPTWQLRTQALSVLPSVLTKTTYKSYLPVLQQLVAGKDSIAAPYVAFLLPTLQPLDQKATNQLRQQLVKNYPNNPYVTDAIISSLQDHEETFQKELRALAPDSSLAINKKLQGVIANIRSTHANKDPKVLLKEFPKGAALFATSCQTCHGPDGNGVAGLAPPLNGSEWVTGDKNKLISIVLFGLTGPVKVKGHLYKAPEINGDMPGIGYDKDLPNEDVAQVLSFIRRSWQNNAEKVSAEEVGKVRQELKTRQKAFTVEELSKI
ncbi:c-type cytochrome [Adhaeribacter swui]|uniref:C-type cytochrome n=1 Tax=Adhaeribacter swui TaxID=2086471 RepID=A0A7G7G9Z1_9BACT|nr:c-type cytochrome [Adhaeribacter swui]QNF33975.1 c-type cytochrome [Adhaeribacter swui]